jgi:DNA-directed RNA polymerase subunit E'/Rpb7
MEQLAIFEEKLSLSPHDLHGEITSIDDILEKKLRRQLEGKCSQHGYVIPNSIELLSRSMGVLEKGRFTGDFLYYVKAQGKVYNPSDGSVVEMKVDIKNNAGVHGIVQNAIEVYVTRDAHIGEEEFHSIQVGDTIRVRILKSRFQIHDKMIVSAGLFLEKVGGGVPPAIKEVPVATEEEKEGVSAAAAAAPPALEVLDEEVIVEEGEGDGEGEGEEKTEE